MEASDTWYYTYNGLTNVESIKGIWCNYKNKDLNNNLLLAYGYGDGGGGANRDMLENKRRIDKIPGLPNIKNSNVTDYLKQLHNTINDEDNNGYLHIWDQELYLEYHRGTFTSQAYNKKMNRILEIMYRNAEMLQIFASLYSKKWNHYYVDMMEKGWKIILRNQFHDIIPGSSIKEVYDDSKKEYTEALEIANNVVRKSMNIIMTQNNKGYALFNSLSWKRNGFVTIPVDDLNDGHFEDEKGNKIAYQIEGQEAKIYIEDIPVISFKNIYWKDERLTQNDCIVRKPLKPFEIITIKIEL